MKSILALALLLSSCSPPASKTDGIESVSFSSGTRGGQKKVVVTAGKVVFDRNGEVWEKALRPDQWSEIVSLLDSVNLPEMETYESPTQERATDGAWYSTLAVVSGGVTYESASFDNTHAPDPLVSLLKAVLALDAEYNAGKKRLFPK